MSAELDPRRRDAIRMGAIEALLDLPRKIDRYEIRGELGRGGMGVVYDAVDPQLERRVAIKVINPALLTSRDGDRALEDRFEREMRAVSPIFHPNVVTILDAGIADLGGQRRAYYVMERVTGETLEDRIRRTGSIDRETLLQIAIAVARGLAALHDEGIVHRDVKPSNVLLPIDREPKVSDFGLIHLVHDPEIGADDSMIAGSAHGLAPEQIHSSTVDERADLFALGALLVRMWTGDEPFAASSLSERLRRIEFASPTGVDALPTDLGQLAKALLAKAPSDRPTDAKEVAQALECMQSSGGAGFFATLRPATARAISLVMAIVAMTTGLLAWSEWRDSRLDREIARERARHESAITAQLERATILAPSLLAPSLVEDLPADERRATNDRLDGIAGRLAFERAQHADRIEELEKRRSLGLSQLLAGSGERASGPEAAFGLVPRAAVAVPLEDPDQHLGVVERAELETQMRLLEREFGLRVQLDVGRRRDAAQDSPVSEATSETLKAPASALRLRIALDPESGTGSIEPSLALESALPDALLGALLREQILPLARRGETAFGLRLAFRVIRERLRSTWVQTDLDSANSEGSAFTSAGFAGGGAFARYDPESEGLRPTLDEAARQRLSAAPSVEATWARFLEWLALETHDVEVGLLTPASREIIRRWPASRPYWRSVRRQAAEGDLVVLARGDVALAHSSDSAELAPSFFRRSAEGWQLDLEAGNAHLLEIAGGEHRWSFRGVSDEPLTRFRDRLVVEDGLIRLSKAN